MSYGPLPKKFDPRKLAERELRIEGDLPLDRMPELSSLLCKQEGSVAVSLSFSVDELRIRIIQGSAHGHVEMTCQRCLEPVEVEVNAQFNLAVAFNEDKAKQLPRYYDPLIVPEDDVELAPMVEEELILSLPHVAYHADCKIKTSFGDAETAETDTEQTNPFSVLANLKANNTLN